MAVFGQLAQQVLGGVVEFGGHVDHEVHVEVAATATVEVFDALMTQSVHGAVRAAGGDLDADRVAQRRHVDRRAQHGLGEGDVGLVVKVVTVAHESSVVLHAQVHEESTVRLRREVRPGRGR